MCVEIVHPDKIQNQLALRDQPLKSLKNHQNKDSHHLRLRRLREQIERAEKQTPSNNHDLKNEFAKK